MQQQNRPNKPLRVVGAMGSKWSEDGLSEWNMHFATSSRSVRVMLVRGSAEAKQNLLPVLAVHGFMMFVAWGILLPSGILAARYLKHVKGDWWFQLHVYLQYSGLAIALLGVLFAAAELRGFSIHSTHVKFGVAAIVLPCMQAVNGYVRPTKPENGDGKSVVGIFAYHLWKVCYYRWRSGPYNWIKLFRGEIWCR